VEGVNLLIFSHTAPSFNSHQFSMGKALKYPSSFDLKILPPPEICCGQEGSFIKQFQMKNERAVWKLGFVATQAAFTAYKCSFMVTAYKMHR
jgi:hypothetical protein